MNREQELLIGSIVLLLSGIWLIYMGYFAKTDKGEPAVNDSLLLKVRMAGPVFLLFFLWCIFKLLFGG